MKLYCLTAGAVFSMSTTFPMGELAPQGGEIRIDVCSVGKDSLDIEKTYMIYNQVAGKTVKDRVCVRDGETKTDVDCWTDDERKILMGGDR